jgi:hypothetical protein
MIKKLYKLMRNKAGFFLKGEAFADFYYYQKYKKQQLPNEILQPAWKSFNIDYSQDVNLVFFCGLGDALYGLAVLLEIRSQCNVHGSKFNVFVSTDLSSTNNPALYDLFRSLNIFDGIHKFYGYGRAYWKYYQWQDALNVAKAQGIGGNFYPFIYKVQSSKNSRSEAVKVQFGMHDVSDEVNFPFKMADRATHLLMTVQAKMEYLATDKHVYLCHFDTRSGSYKYPDAEAFITRLLKDGNIVITPKSTQGKKIDKHTDNHIILDNSIDIFSLGLVLRELNCKIVAVNSVFWPISGIFELDILGLHYLRDVFGHHFTHPKMFFITSQKKAWNKVSNSFLAINKKHYHKNKNLFMIDYELTFIWSIFRYWNTTLE